MPLTIVDALSGANPSHWLAAGVDIDGTALVATALFIATWFFLKVLIFDPYLKLVDQRDEQIEGARDDAASMEARAEETLAEYDRRLVEARSEASALRDEARTEGEQRRDALVTSARDDAGEHLRASRAQMEAGLDTARAQLDAKARDLSGAIVDRLLSVNG